MLGKLALVATRRPRAWACASQFGRCRLVAADHRVAAQQLARVALQAIAQAVGKEAHRRERGHGQHHGHGQQAQFTGAEVAQPWRQARAAIEGGLGWVVIPGRYRIPAPARAARD
jgi:hypothetical protein